MKELSNSQFSSTAKVNCAFLVISKCGLLPDLYRCTVFSVRSAGFILYLLFLTSTVSAQDRLANDVRFAELPNFGRVNERLYRGGQPQTGGIQKLASLGINTIINLRADDERALAEEREAKLEGLRYFNVPFKTWSRPSDSQVDRVLSLINATENGVVFVHCHRGRDRTGTVVAIYRLSQDRWTLREAKREANRFGMRLWQRGMKKYIADYYRKRSVQVYENLNANKEKP
jgi:protein tyrosine/serine phosphatase